MVPNGTSAGGPPCQSANNTSASTDTFGGYWYEVICAKQHYPAGKGAFHGDGASGLSAERFNTITDGTSNTIFVGERHVTQQVASDGTDPYRRAGFWANSFNLYTLSAALPAGTPGASYLLTADWAGCVSATNQSNYCKYGWGSLHSGGQINFLFGDGSVRGISQTIDPAIFAALSTIGGSEVVPNF
jgi:prepilin-type processing-associated H-X9-DG protein